jgi:hypothetical protein
MTRHFARRVFKRLADSRGTNLLEAAIITPLLLLLTFGIAEFGLVFWVWCAMQNGASLATRYAVTGNVMTGLNREESIRAAFRDATPSLTLDDAAFTFDHMVPGGNSWVAGVGGPNDIGKVTVNYTWTVITPFIRPFFDYGQINFAVESAMKNEGLFN